MGLEDAFDLLNDTFGEFPFADGPSYANFMALLIAGIIGPAVDAKPVFLINKATWRTGATLMAQLVSIILSGRMPEETGTLDIKNDESIRKALGLCRSDG